MVGRRTIIREGNRFKLYLPENLKDLWTILVGTKVKVFLETEETIVKRHSSSIHECLVLTGIHLF